MTRGRRTQAERTAETRARLLDATIDTLVDLGYSRTTTTEIAVRAGVSRGAQLHHFRTKAELVATAWERLFDRRLAEFRGAIGALPEASSSAAIDLLWSMVTGPTGVAWLELSVAARTDRELRRHVVALSRRFRQSVAETFADLFPPPAEPSLFYAVAPAFIFSL